MLGMKSYEEQRSDEAEESAVLTEVERYPCLCQEERAVHAKIPEGTTRSPQGLAPTPRHIS